MASYTAQDDELVISHDGSRECPVDIGASVQIIRRDASTSAGPAGLYFHSRDCFNSWKHNGGNSDIIAYRVVSAA